MQLLIIRHGESQADLLDVHEGRADFELTPRGHEQAKAMGRRVAREYPVAKLYSSPLKRAYQTASHLAGELDLEIETEEKLMEFNNGLIAGMQRKDVMEKYPFVPGLPLHQAVYEQESMLDFRYRAEFILSKILSENNGQETVAVVTHGGMINQLYRSFLCLPVASDVFFSTGDTGIHEWDISKASRRIVRCNDCRHTQGL